MNQRPEPPVLIVNKYTIQEVLDKYPLNLSAQQKKDLIDDIARLAGTDIENLKGLHRSWEEWADKIQFVTNSTTVEVNK